MTSQQEQQQMLHLVDQINLILAGTPIMIAETSLKLVILTHIVAMEPNNEKRRAHLADALHSQIKRDLDRKEVIDHIKACIYPHSTHKIEPQKPQ